MKTFPARGLLLAAAIATATLAACSRSQPDEAVEANVEMPAEAANALPAEPAPLPEPSPVENVTQNVVDLPPEEAPAPDEQVLDDASITGMTARAQRDGVDDEAPAKQK
ncbi:hypothetical protein [Sphingomonas adhaesiva]|uniref:hypothetical protein n=1 Tax=Sphingomonas adhaesiva TaxID=28212 RepID=UPI002FF65FA8